MKTRKANTKQVRRPAVPPLTWMEKVALWALAGYTVKNPTWPTTLADTLIRTALSTVTLRDLLLRKGVISEQELEEARKETDAMHEVEMTLRLGTREFEERFKRRIRKAREEG